MKKLILILLAPLACFAQSTDEYEPSVKYPYGRLNPEAPQEVADFAPLIGTCDCLSEQRKSDGSWRETENIVWKWKYIMNGTAVQDETLKPDGSHSGSIRQFIADSSKWYVHYYSNKGPTPALPAWEGGRQGDSIVLYREQKAPNGMEGFYRITFSDMTETGFNWLGEWVDRTEKIRYPTWKIECKKRLAFSEEDKIRENIRAFSAAYMEGDAEKIAGFYTSDGKLFPGGRDIIQGYDGILNYWNFSPGSKDMYHKITPLEIRIFRNYAYDYGYYEGSITNDKGKKTDFQGKYVIVWRKENGLWKILLDIWNRN